LNYIEKNPGTNRVDCNSLMNIAYLAALSNIQIGDKPPLEYMKELDCSPEFRSVLDEHLVTLLIMEWVYVEEMPENALDVFIEKRVDSVIKRLRMKLEGVRVQEVDTAEQGTIDLLKAASSPAVTRIVATGEGPKVEFKSTLRQNLHTGDKDRKMEHACLKTIAALVNTKGGHLVIGVNDEGEPLGLGADGFPNEDKMHLHLVNLIKRSIGAEHMLYIDPRFEDFRQKRVLVVECQPGRSPVYLSDGGKEYFYVRTGAATTELEMSKVQDFITKRFLS
jgi:hypothetical protein